MTAKEDLEQIIEAGLYVANGMGKQATITVAVTNKELRDRLSAINAKIGGWKEGFDPFYGAPAILILRVRTSRISGIIVRGLIP